MTRDDIISMYEKANGWCPTEWDETVKDLERFAELVAAAEREVCAQICGEVGEHPSLTPRHCAEAIRARGQV